MLGKRVDEKGYMVSIGDAMTAGTNSTFITPISGDNYAAYTAKRLGYRLVNLSYPLATTRSALSQAERMREIAKRRGAPADIVTIFIGANDVFRNRSAKEFEKNLASIIGTAKECGKRVVVLGLPDLRNFQNIKSRAAPIFHSLYGVIGLRVASPATWGRFDQFNRIIEKCAKKGRVMFIDLHSHKFTKEDLGVDRLHPGRRGHVRLSEHICKKLKQK